MGRNLVGDRAGVHPLNALIAIAIAFSIVLVAYFTLFVQRPTPQTPYKIATVGDGVEIDYVGLFQDSGRVFDTSRESVARDNASWPKAVSFAWRASWLTFAFKVGSGEAIAGFDLGVQGARENESRTLIVPPEQGYGFPDPSKISVRPLVQQVPGRETMSSTEFQGRFGVLPVNGAMYVDSVWRWNVTVVVDNDVVTITHSPRIGQVIRPYDAWDATVIAIDDTANAGVGQVTLRHDLGPSDSGNIEAQDANGAFIVTHVDPTAGTFTVDYNREVVGKTLVFLITVVKITKL